MLAYDGSSLVSVLFFERVRDQADAKPYYCEVFPDSAT